MGKQRQVGGSYPSNLLHDPVKDARTNMELGLRNQKLEGNGKVTLMGCTKWDPGT